MAGAGTITKLGPSLMACIAAGPSYWQFDVTEDGSEHRLKFDTYEAAYGAQYNATTEGFAVSEIVAVHKLA